MLLRHRTLAASAVFSSLLDGSAADVSSGHFSLFVAADTATADGFTATTGKVALGVDGCKPLTIGFHPVAPAVVGAKFKTTVAVALKGDITYKCSVDVVAFVVD